MYRIEKYFNTNNSLKVKDYSGLYDLLKGTELFKVLYGMMYNDKDN